jgi:hypothetical protein
VCRDDAADDRGHGVHVTADLHAGPDGRRVVVEVGGGAPDRERHGVLRGDLRAVAETSCPKYHLERSLKPCYGSV